jgi:hypothetical protein
MRTIIAVIASLFAIVGIFLLGRCAINQTAINQTVEDFQANLASLYQKAERAIAGWFRRARTDATA